MSSVTTYGADANWLVDITKKLIAVDSTVGYYCEIEPVMSSLVAHGAMRWTGITNTRDMYILRVSLMRDVCALRPISIPSGLS